ncbi:sodium-dependent transporter [Agathobaculum desmolans]|uniref:sodium-dependent transporter n=1 Tax=Agathobaculum desmolans TaxID=39484 RepID=UPI0004E13E12|nr:sodium-dependent transporter [Agathobaculum desmolans]
MNQKSKNGTFTSKVGFVLAAVGSAVGMGNIWMFPYRTGQYGGAAFLIPYLLFVALFGYVGLSGEFAFGRLTGTGPIGSYEYAMQTRGKKGGAFLGAIPLFGSLGIAIGYSIIVGWVVRSAFGALTGSLMTTEPEAFFAEMSATHLSSVPWHVIVVLITIAILIFGVSGGIEKINKVMMPAFFILFLIIAVRVAFLPGAIQGYKYLLVPQWEYLLNPKTWIYAMGQAFFSLSVTGSGMIIYGSYLSKKEDVVHSSCMTAVLDTCAAMLAGFAILPAVFSFGLDPAAGPSLLFITLPRVFQQMPAGRLFALLFFISVLFAGITSLANMLEAVSEAAQTRLKMNRKPAVLLAGAATLAVGLFIEKEPLMGRWMDIITLYVVPIGAILGAVMIYWVLGTKRIKTELMEGRDKPLSPLFDPLAKYVYVFLAAIVVICSFVIPGGIG